LVGRRRLELRTR